MARVVGYYEGAAAHRSCDPFQPRHIQASAYTHINFAHAFIDPDTFQVVPADKRDSGVYQQLTRLSPGVKVFISVGGWAFSESSANGTFSEMISSEPHQRTFIKSLISFLNTYGFDGVDIDWRYPGAADRGGNPDDISNFVVFIRNLQMALRNNGLRQGLSVTIPAVYSYLKNYDLRTLANNVDWFNVMAFDLHGELILRIETRPTD